MDEINRRVGSNIRRQREQRSWSQGDLSEASGLPVRTIGRIERAAVDVRLSTLAKIAKALRVEVEDLLQ